MFVRFLSPVRSIRHVRIKRLGTGCIKTRIVDVHDSLPEVHIRTEKVTWYFWTLSGITLVVLLQVEVIRF